MSLLDLAVLVAYAIGLLALVLFAGRSETREDFLCNSRATSLGMLICSTVATWVGSGAIIGVSSAAFTTGISYGLSVIAINVGVMVVFAYFAPRIKAFGDASGAYTVGQFIAARFGTRCQLIFAFSYLGILAIWMGSQLLAAGNLLAIMTGIGVWTGVFLAFGITLTYSAIGGLKSDILTDALQFWVMLVAFILMVPIAIFKVGGYGGFQQLPVEVFNPYKFGGETFFYASVFLGLIYPLVDACNWQRIYSARGGAAARRAFIISAPLILFFLVSSVVLGLVSRLLLPQETPPDQAIFGLMRQVLPSGVLGLAYASIFAVVMSTVDSLIVAGTATLSCDILPAFRRSESSLTGLRIFAVLIGAAALGIAYIFPSIVQLSVIAAFTSLCFAPAMLVGLFNWKVSPNAVFVSMILALIALFLGQSTLGNLNFIAIIAAGCLPILFDLARSGLRLRASPPQA